MTLEDMTLEDMTPENMIPEKYEQLGYDPGDMILEDIEDMILKI